LRVAKCFWQKRPSVSLFATLCDGVAAPLANLAQIVLIDFGRATARKDGGYNSASADKNFSRI
jgi:hypothetical protein